MELQSRRVFRILYIQDTVGDVQYGTVCTVGNYVRRCPFEFSSSAAVEPFDRDGRDLSYGVCRADLKARPSQDHQDHTHVKYGEEQYFDN